jgi:hypothetical protein
MFQKVVRSVYRVLAWSIVGGLVLQVYLAGLGVFRFRTFGETQSYFGLHIEFGFLLGFATLLLLVLAILGRFSRPIIGRIVLLLFLHFMQSVFLYIDESSALLRAFHPVNGIAIGWMSLWLARWTSVFSENSAEAPLAVEEQPA